VDEVEKCEGEARVNNRKGKLIFFYEWEITLKWRGFANGKDTEVKGKIEIPNLSEEHEDLKDVDVDVSITTKGDGDHLLKDMLRKGPGADKIRAQLAAYIAALRFEYSQGLILPKKGAADNNAAPTAASKVNLNISNKVKGLDLKNLDIGGCKVELADLEVQETMKCTGQELYNALTQRDMIQIFTGAAANMEEEAAEGKEFQMLSGNITGVFIELVPFTKIVQQWRLKSWPHGVFSRVEMTIKQTEDDTKITVKQTGVPVKELETTKLGWTRYYFEAMKRTFGFGATLY